MQIALSQTSHGFVPLPLCTSYEAVHVAVVNGLLVKSRPRSGGPTTWALGVLRDGRCEVLGVWPTQVLGPEAEHLVAVDLAERGLEHFKFLINGGSEALESALLSLCPSAAAALPFHPIAELVMSVALPRDRKLVSQGLGRVHRSQTARHAHAVLDSLVASSWLDSPVAAQFCRVAIGKWQAVYALSQRARVRLRRGEDVAWALQQGVSRVLTRHGPFERAEAAAAFVETWLRDAVRRRQCRAVIARHRASVAAARAG